MTSWQASQRSWRTLIPSPEHAPAEATIRTERLVISPFSERYLTDRYVGWLNDHQLMRFSEQRHRRHTLESCRSYMRSFEGTPNYFWAVEDVTYGLGHIGNINSYVDVRNRVADIGILIGEPGAGGKGLALEAWKAVCRFLFESARVRKITAGTMALNAAMVRLALKAGMTEDGVRRRQLLCEGQEVDVLYFATFATEPENQPR